MPAATQHQSLTPNGTKDEWRTPPWVFERAVAKFGPFDIDAAADRHNHLCDYWLGPGGMSPDALRSYWFRLGVPIGTCRVWCNPPYSRGQVAAFLKRARDEVDRDHCLSATLLIPADTGTRYWHEYVWDEHALAPRWGVLIDFLPRRVRFLRPDGTLAGSPPFPSALVHLYKP